jgi:uncharacterized paraquat-inducible protein A
MRCPVCESSRIVVLVNRHRSAFCTHCGSRWRQQGQRQWSVNRLSRTEVGRRAPGAAR